MKKYNETFKATLSNGDTQTVSAWNELEAKMYFKREFCTNEEGDPNGVTIVELVKTTNHNA